MGGDHAEDMSDDEGTGLDEPDQTGIVRKGVVDAQLRRAEEVPAAGQGSLLVMKTRCSSKSSSVR